MICWFLIGRLEGTAPVVSLELSSLSLGKSRKISVTAADDKNGIAEIRIEIVRTAGSIRFTT